MKKRIFPDAAHNSYVEKECVCSRDVEALVAYFQRETATHLAVWLELAALADLRSAFWRVIDRSIGIELSAWAEAERYRAEILRRVYGDTVDSQLYQKQFRYGFRAAAEQLSAGKAPVHRETRWKPQQATL